MDLNMKDFIMKEKSQEKELFIIHQVKNILAIGIMENNKAKVKLSPNKVIFKKMDSGKMVNLKSLL